MTWVVDIVLAAVLVTGAGFTATAALGVVRLPDFYMRTHAATKAGTLGSGLILLAVAGAFLADGEWTVTLKALAAIAFLLLTAPVAGHLLGRAARVTGVPLARNSVVDQWGLPATELADPRPASSLANPSPGTPSAGHQEDPSP